MENSKARAANFLCYIVENLAYPPIMSGLYVKEILCNTLYKVFAKTGITKQLANQPVFPIC
jgi:hypothetical protein